jgi:TPR repeat protein
MPLKWFTRIIMLVALASAPGVNATTLEAALKSLDARVNANAIEVVRKHANDGDALAQLRLGSLYYHGQGIVEDEIAAIGWWKKSAAGGNAEAMYQIAHAYLFGTTAAKSVADPDREAAIWCIKAANANHADAAYTLGLLLIAGKGVIEDKAEAVRWFRLAAAQGHAEARKAVETTEKAILRPVPKPKR